ncbi:MAG: DUF805 domain-containing protein [Endomicrobia bacterium]|nr:DUF805 domain-containing protein [Endomicrobiia bacterium]MCL2507316.1 DUF805 domain-containing protein [Endomicrobiia bacterium]
MDQFIAWFKVNFWNILTKQYVDFTGRTGRAQFWYFVLISFVINLLLGMISGGVLNLLVWLALIIPSIAITARRLHDINQTGWLQLVAIIPLLGWIALIILCVLPAAEPNKYGSAAVAEATPAPAEGK